MGMFSPGTDANGPSFWPREGSDVRQTPYCLFWNDGWRCRFLELGYGRLPGNSPTPVYQDGQTPGSHHPGARACATDFSALRTVPTFAVIGFLPAEQSESAVCEGGNADGGTAVIGSFAYERY
jgi:hypothetical protein